MQIFVGNTNLVELVGLTDPLTGTAIDDATVTVTVSDKDGDPIAGQSWPLTLSYVPGSAGDYRASIDAAAQLVEGQIYIVLFTATASQGVLSWSETVRAQTRSSCTD